MQSDADIQKSKTERTMEVVAERCAYYRANPQRFAKDILNIQLKLFQQILLWAMFHIDNFYFIAARGLGKTYLVGLFAVIKCILWPGTKVVACSYTFKQGKEIILKITDDFMRRSSLLCAEISTWSTGQNDCSVHFKNGSYIRVVVAGESSRGARSNVLIIDESRLVDQKIVDTILRPMNAAPRQPGYLNKPEYSNLQEMNKEMYMSSAYFAASEMFDKVKSYTANMLDPSLNYFVCDLPYQLSISEGLLMREQIENEMSEATFNDVTFMMEREGLFYGSAEDSLFDLKLLTKQRVVVQAIHNLDFYRMTGVAKMPDKQKGEYRVLSVDIALMASRKHNNDASALILHSAVPTGEHEYQDNIVRIDTVEGLVTDELGLMVMRYFYQYDCDYLAIDANGVGQAVLDYIMADRYDPVYGTMYGALNCINNPELEARCRVRNAPKVIYAIKANARSNNDMCLALRAGFQNGSINLLIDDSNTQSALNTLKGYKNLSQQHKAELEMPYVQTTLLIDELINLTYESSGGLIRVKERPGMRKDRYSSLMYGYYVVQELGKKLKPRVDQSPDWINKFKIRSGTVRRTFT